jgi:hypothetical protein
MTVEQNKLLIQRLVKDAANQGHLDVPAEVADDEFAQAARQWVGPFREAFPDFSMEIVDLVAEEERGGEGGHAVPLLGYPPGGVDGPPAVRPAVPGRRRDLPLPGAQREADGRDRSRGQPQPDAATRPRRLTLAGDPPAGDPLATSRFK